MIEWGEVESFLLDFMGRICLRSLVLLLGVVYMPFCTWRILNFSLFASQRAWYAH